MKSVEEGNEKAAYKAKKLLKIHELNCLTLHAATFPVKDEKEIAKKARAITKKYAEMYIRAPLWIQNIPFGLGPRVKYWEPTPGRVFAVNFEFLELHPE